VLETRKTIYLYTTAETIYLYRTAGIFSDNIEI